MKTALSLLVAAAPIAAPLVSFGSFAQPANGPVTRAEVVAQLSRLELVGYEPFKSAYPDDMQAAEARVAEATGAGGEPGVSSAIGPSRDDRAVAACACALMPPGESRRITSTAFALAHAAPRRPGCCCRRQRDTPNAPSPRGGRRAARPVAGPCAADLVDQ
ncbi:DUF4148 domain-containing protein [Burkholderia multivorans]|uniref:DUF4148 domain-containing protein n=1 Tax=Burkholderia multivorans TaxID=87883 RepID=UPI0020B1CCED|nr:DUF4148 domain-containing protein [Burkholderia multivorans]